ncbi:hypothetical protein ACC718_32945 [Rhizobium ruizarguesonis]
MKIESVPLQYRSPIAETLGWQMPVHLGVEIADAAVGMIEPRTSAYVHLDRVSVGAKMVYLESGGFFNLSGVDAKRPDEAYHDLVDTFYIALRTTRDLLSDFLVACPQPPARQAELERRRREKWHAALGPGERILLPQAMDTEIRPNEKALPINAASWEARRLELRLADLDGPGQLTALLSEDLDASALTHVARTMIDFDSNDVRLIVNDFPADEAGQQQWLSVFAEFADAEAFRGWRELPNRLRSEDERIRKLALQLASVSRDAEALEAISCGFRLGEEVLVHDKGDTSLWAFIEAWIDDIKSIRNHDLMMSFQWSR